MRINLKVVSASALSAIALASTSAFAALPVNVTTAMTDATADAAELGGLALVAILAAVAFKYARRAL